MFDGLKRKVIFGKVADALERWVRGGSSGDGKTLGWDMQQWRGFLEGALWTFTGGAAGVLLERLNAYNACIAQKAACLQQKTAECLAAANIVCTWSWKATLIAALVGGVTLLVPYLRRNPSDPRRVQ